MADSLSTDRPPRHLEEESHNVVVSVKNVRKSFCRSLKRSLWYGLQDAASEFIGGKEQNHLRPDEFWAVNDVSFELRRGQCIGLIGHNGAGKTTLLKLLNGLIKPDGGTISIRGRVGALIALGAGFNPILSGRENVFINAAVLGMTQKETKAKFDQIVEFSGIEEFIDAPVQSYSSGMAVRLGFAIAVHTNPDILLLDEVLAVGDVGFQAKCFNTLARLREQGTAFILVSHNMHQIERYSDEVLYLKAGQLAYNGAADAGIKAFLNDMRSSDDNHTDEHETNWDQINGSGKIVFTSARFLSQDHVQVTKIDAGAPLIFEIDYERRDDLTNPPILDVVIRDRNGIVYQGTNVRDGFPFSKGGTNTGKYIVKFSSIPINSEYLDFFIVLLDSRTLEVFDWKRHLRLMIQHVEGEHGRLLLKPQWHDTSCDDHIGVASSC